ncbi:MAG: hypothetical protein WCT20_03780 [Candidatus Babeliales bacterium]
MWYIIILSAILYSGAFFIQGAEFCILLSPFPLFYGLTRARNIRCALGYGLLWGYVVFGSVSWWALVVLCRYSDAHIIGSLCLYAVAIGYFAMTVALWFGATWGWIWWCDGLIKNENLDPGLRRGDNNNVHMNNTVNVRRRHHRAFVITAKALIHFLNECEKYVGIIGLGIGYFIFVDRWILFPLGKVEGYPFIMPYVPLAACKPFLQACALISYWCNGVETAAHQWQEQIELNYIAPVVNKNHCQQVYADKPSAVGQEIYWRLCKAQRDVDKAKTTLFVGPESAYPFVVNNDQTTISLWQSALNEHQYLLMGGYYEIKGKLYQTIFQWDKGRIMHFYVKKHCVPFVEKIHHSWRALLCAHNLFLKGLRFFSRGNYHIGCGILQVPGRVDIIPQICSELFMKTNTKEIQTKKRASRHPVVFVFVNDSWFCVYFKRLMQLIARLKAAWWGIDVVYIGHDGLSIFYPP